MAVAFVNAQSGKASAASLTVSVTVGSGANRFFAASVHMRGSATVSAVTLNGSSIAGTQIGSGLLAGSANNNGRRLHVYYSIAPSTGTYDCILTPSASAQLVMGCTHWTGVHQTTPNGTEASDTDTATASLTAAPASTTSDIVFVAFTAANVTTDISPDGSQTQIFEDIQTSTYGASSYIAGASGTTAVGYTVGGTPAAGIGQALLAFAIKPAASTSDAAITQADGAATASALAGASTAAASLSAAAGAATASALAGASAAVASITSAAGSASAAEMAGASTAVAAFDAAAGAATAAAAGASTAVAAFGVAAGAATASELTGVAGSGSTIGVAAGEATTSALAGASDAAAAIGSAAGAANESALAGSSTAVAAFSPAAGASVAGDLVGTTAGDASDISPAAGQSTAAIIVGASFAAAAMGAAAGTATAVTLAAAVPDVPLDEPLFGRTASGPDRRVGSGSPNDPGRRVGGRSVTVRTAAH